MHPPRIAAAAILNETGQTLQWAALLGLSALLAGLFMALGLPAALLMGPMLAGIAITASGGRIGLSEPLFALAQGLVGCMIGGMLSTMMAAAPTGDGHWGVAIGGALLVIVISTILSWFLNRLGVLPGTTALWGLSPGAATVMAVMSEGYGANSQIVALMQYLRLVLVVVIASTTARILGANTHHALADAYWLAPVRWGPFAATMALAVAGALIALRLRIPAGGLLLPLFAGAGLIEMGWLQVELPPLLLALGYAAIGWRIGLRFTPATLLLAAKALPQILACTLALILSCAGLAALLVVEAGIDPLTAFVATSPGGADTAAIIAASSHKIDAGFVMTMQTVRFVAVLFAAPALARALSRRAPR